MVVGLILALAMGCAPVPAKITIDGEATVSTHELKDVALPGVKVLDAKNAAIKDAKVTWTVAPPEVATLKADGKTIELVGEGDAVATAKIGDKVKAEFKVSVGLPDEVAISGATEGQELPLGTTAALTGAVNDRGNAIADLKVEWKSSDDTIATVADGVVTPVKEGEVTISAKSGELAKDLKLKVVPAAAVAADAAAAAPPK
jgi:hypothetical protein